MEHGGGSIVVTGRSRRFSFDEAFAQALKQVPDSPAADGMKRLRVTEIGALVGGLAGYNELYVKAEAAVDGIGSRLVDFLVEMALDPQLVERVKLDPDAVMKSAGLSDEEIVLIKRGDIQKIHEELHRQGLSELGPFCVFLGLLDEQI